LSDELIGKWFNWTGDDTWLGFQLGMRLEISRRRKRNTSQLGKQYSNGGENRVVFVGKNQWALYKSSVFALALLK